MYKMRYGYCAVGFPLPGIGLLESIRQEGAKALQKVDMEKVEYPNLVTDFDGCSAAGQFFRQEKVNAVIINFAGFLGGGEILRLSRELNHIPLVLWGFGTGPTLTLTGLIEATSDLGKTNRRFLTVVGNPGDAATIRNITTTLKAIDAYSFVQEAHIGYIGYAAPGMVDVAVDEISLRRKIGCELFHLDLMELVQEYRSLKDEEAVPLVDELKSKVGKILVNDTELLESARLYLALRNIVERYRLDAIAMRCWPELRGDPPNLHVTSCYAYSRLNDEGVMAACEADVSSAVTMLILNRLTGKPPASFDYSTVNMQKNSLGFWHCGPHALSLAESPQDVVVRAPTIGGVEEWGGGCVLQFSIKEGKATFAKLTQEYDKMSIASGKFVRPSYTMRGGIGEAVMDTDANSYLKCIMDAGFEHHVCAVHGDVKDELLQICRLAEISPFIF